MLIALFAAHLFQTAPTAADFFALTPGMIRSFVDGANLSSEEVLTLISVDGKPVLPVVERAEGKVISRGFYRVEPNAVYLLGYDDQSNWLPEPMPIIRFDGREGKWSFSGMSGTGRAAQPVNFAGECKSVREEDVFGKRVPVLEVRMQGTMGGGASEEHYLQVAKYAIGVGMFEFRSSTQTGRHKTPPVVRRLTKVEGAKSNG